jgi:hypothetical protein
MNSWPWRMVDRETLEEVINDFFAQAHKAKMQGKDAECKELTTKALRLQGSLTKMKPIELDKKEEKDTNVRVDTFARVVHRRKGDLHPDDVYGDSVDDRTLRHTFKV